MSRSDRDLIDDARHHLSSALAAAVEQGLDAVWSDRTSRQSFILDLIVMSEALGKLSPEVKALSGHIPWRRIADTRNRLVHSYWRQDRAFFAVLLQESLPELLVHVSELEAAIETAR